MGIIHELKKNYIEIVNSVKYAGGFSSKLQRILIKGFFRLYQVHIPQLKQEKYKKKIKKLKLKYF